MTVEQTTTEIVNEPLLKRWQMHREYLPLKRWQTMMKAQTFVQKMEMIE